LRGNPVKSDYEFGEKVVKFNRINDRFGGKVRVLLKKSIRSLIRMTNFHNKSSW
jgi:hypothetical protein